jgi:hypothetical protein
MGNCSGCSQQQMNSGCTTSNNYITINDTVNTFINGVLATVVVNHTNILQVVTTCPDGSSSSNSTNQGAWEETIYSSQNTGGGGNNLYYINNVTTPNTSVGALTVGNTYWALTSVPSACSASNADQPCTVVGIKVTGISGGKYTYQLLSGQSQTWYIAGDPYGTPVKNAIASALYIDGYPFVVVN